MKFRFDINGLRALAVVAVILFHFDEKILPAGYAGVDVFFVISGYLMTRIIFERLAEMNFSILSFYQSRVVRIVPPLIVTVLSIVAIGWAISSPAEYKQMAHHGISSLFFFSNWTYLQESGYFDLSSHKKWFLHTWSLSVEWQFYLLYPIVLAGTGKILPLKRLRYFVLILFLGLLAYSLFKIKFEPVAAYYRPECRIWEMLAGALVFFYPLRISDGLRGVLQALGLLGIGISFFIFSSLTAWPGYSALLPVVCACAILSANFQKGILNQKAVQVLGAWSYSLYLVHWPVLLISKKMDIQSSLFYFLGTSTAGVILHYGVEKRKFNAWKWGVLFVLVLSALCFIENSEGAASRVSEKYRLNQQQYHSKFYGGVGYPAGEWFFLNGNSQNIDFIFVGDSFGLQYAKSLQESGAKVAAFFAHGCIILPNYSRWLNGQEYQQCSNFYETVIQQVSKFPKVPIVLAYSWQTYQNVFIKKGNTDRIQLSSFEYQKILSEELSLFIRLSEGRHRYLLVGQVQKAQEDIYDCLARRQLLARKILSPCSLSQDEDRGGINLFLRSFADRSQGKVDFLDPNEPFCSKGLCQLSVSGMPVHSDQEHLSVYGAEIVAQRILKKITQMNER